MALSKVEVNLLRLLEAAPRQQNQAKLVHVSVAHMVFLK
jgi:SNARE protein 1